MRHFGLRETLGCCYCCCPMTDDTALATKADIRKAIDLIDRCIKNLHTAEDRWKDEMIAHMDRRKNEIRWDCDARASRLRQLPSG